MLCMSEMLELCSLQSFFEVKLSCRTLTPIQEQNQTTECLFKFYIWKIFVKGLQVLSYRPFARMLQLVWKLQNGLANHPKKHLKQKKVLFQWFVFLVFINVSIPLPPRVVDFAPFDAVSCKRPNKSEKRKRERERERERGRESDREGERERVKGRGRGREREGGRVRERGRGRERGRKTGRKKKGKGEGKKARKEWYGRKERMNIGRKARERERKTNT